MGLKLRLPTPSDFLRHLDFVVASGVVACLSLVTLILQSIFCRNFKEYFDYDILFKYLNVKALFIVGLIGSTSVIVIFIVELLLVTIPSCKSCRTNGGYILAMVILTYIFILIGFCVGICMIVNAKHYDFNNYEGEQLNALMSLLNVGIFKVTAWSLSLLIFIGITVVFAKMFKCE